MRLACKRNIGLLTGATRDSTFSLSAFLPQHLKSLVSYGERGYVQIFKIIDELFPDLAVTLRHDPNQRLGLDVFISRILVPETARLLIKDDLCISDQEAFSVLLKSRAFGVALHPDLDKHNIS